jgi:hypothetical protein
MCVFPLTQGLSIDTTLGPNVLVSRHRWPRAIATVNRINSDRAAGDSGSVLVIFTRICRQNSRAGSEENWN